eukprot:GHVU01217145.1.p1 GENE.GHVU01217145.1~~GHVU01217145.1.p1  ORF type:complete len:481 (-),score=58.39 GHVU01217145.1:267-1709(-)
MGGRHRGRRGCVQSWRLAACLAALTIVLVFSSTSSQSYVVPQVLQSWSAALPRRESRVWLQAPLSPSYRRGCGGGVALRRGVGFASTAGCKWERGDSASHLHGRGGTVWQGSCRSEGRECHSRRGCTDSFTPLTESPGLPSARLDALPPKYFINLSNGIELIPRVTQVLGIPASSLSYVRLQSTHCEGGHLNEFLNSVDSNLLLALAMGFPCFVFDCGSRDQSGVPRALWMGLKFIRFSCIYVWFRGWQRPHFLPSRVTMRHRHHLSEQRCGEVGLPRSEHGNGANVARHWRNVCHYKLSVKTKRRLKYFGKFVAPRVAAAWRGGGGGGGVALCPSRNGREEGGGLIPIEAEDEPGEPLGLLREVGPMMRDAQVVVGEDAALHSSAATTTTADHCHPPTAPSRRPRCFPLFGVCGSEPTRLDGDKSVLVDILWRETTAQDSSQASAASRRAAMTSGEEVLARLRNVSALTVVDTDDEEDE